LGHFTTHLANGIIKHDILAAVSVESEDWICDFLSPPKKSQTALQFARNSLNLMSGWKWSLGACRVWTLNGQASNIPFSVSDLAVDFDAPFFRQGSFL